MEAVYGPSSMGPILIKADLATSAAECSTCQQETNTKTKTHIFQHPSWKTSNPLGGNLMTLDLFILEGAAVLDWNWHVFLTVRFQLALIFGAYKCLIPWIGSPVTLPLVKRYTHNIKRIGKGHTIVGSTSFVTYESRWPGRVTKPFFEGLAVCHTSLEMILFEKWGIILQEKPKTIIWCCGPQWVEYWIWESRDDSRRDPFIIGFGDLLREMFNLYNFRFCGSGPALSNRNIMGATCII